MKPHIRYLSYVLRHKWHVLYAGWYLRVPFWRLLIHDASKFSRAEWGPYVRRFFAGRGSQWEKDADPTEFHMAWYHHWTRNPHHWEYWLAAAYEPATPLEMPEAYVREMVADWYGAGMAQGKPEIEAWYDAHCDQMLLHPSTRMMVERVIGEAKLLHVIRG
jgi:hypothetical protein